MWNLKMEDILVDKEQWAVVDLGTKPTAMSKEDWDKLDRKVSKYNSPLSLRFGTAECLWRRLCKEAMGKIRESMSVEVLGKQFFSLKETISP